MRTTTITEQMTSISTTIDRRWLTKWTHYPIDTATPCVTWTYYTDATALPEQEDVFSAPLNDVTHVHPTKAAVPWLWTNWVLFLLLITMFSMLFIFFRLDLVSARVATAQKEAEKTKLELKTEKKLCQKWKDKSYDTLTIFERFQQETQGSIAAIERRNMMLKFLGVYKDGDRISDEGILNQMVRERKAALEDREKRMDEIVAESNARFYKIIDFENRHAQMREIIKTRLNKRFVPGIDSSYQSLLDDKQREIHYWRDAFFHRNLDEIFESSHRLHEEKDAEILQLRLLPAKISQLEQALQDALEQIDTVKQGKKDQGVADRRRWNEEKYALEKKHADAIRVLKADLKEAKQASNRVRNT